MKITSYVTKLSSLKIIIYNEEQNLFIVSPPPPPKRKLTIFIQYEQPSSKCDKEKLGHVCLILYILAIDPGPCHLGVGVYHPPPPQRKVKKGAQFVKSPGKGKVLNIKEFSAKLV